MPSLAPSPTARHDELDNYDVDDFSDDPFASPLESSNKKRKEPESGLGIDQEVSVQKRARVPNVKLDEDRLLGPNGIPKLRKRARDLKIKGKGHEFSDAARLLSFYQLWLDDLFPKARFLDALNMVEKAGHKKRVTAARTEYINEGKPQSTVPADDNDDLFGEGDGDEPTLPPLNSGPDAPISERPKTPEHNDDIPDDDDDLYDATPRASRPALPIRNDKQLEEDDLEALIAKAEGQGRKKNLDPQAEPDENDLDALIAEAEGQDQNRQDDRPANNKDSGSGQGGDSFDDDEAAMQEMEGLW